MIMHTRLVARLSVLLLALVVGVAWSGSASALSIDPDPLGWTSNSGSTGEFTLVGFSEGGGTTTFTFQASHDPGSTGNDIDAIRVGIFLVTPTGASTSGGPGVDVVASVDNINSIAVFDFDPSPLAPGETSDPFSVSFSTADVDIGDDLIVTIDDGVGASHLVEIVATVPEPGLGLLLGLVGLGLVRRRA